MLRLGPAVAALGGAFAAAVGFASGSGSDNSGASDDGRYLVDLVAIAACSYRLTSMCCCSTLCIHCGQHWLHKAFRFE